MAPNPGPRGIPKILVEAGLFLPQLGQTFVSRSMLSPHPTHNAMFSLPREL